MPKPDGTRTIARRERLRVPDEVEGGDVGEEAGAPVANEASGRRGARVLVAASLFAVVGLAGVLFLRGPEEPSAEQLEILYPYGFSGGRLARGKPAPPASLVGFTFKGVETCGASACERFEVNGEGGFRMEMLVKQRGDGWELVGGPHR